MRTIARFPDLRAMVELIAKSGMRICGLFLVLGLFVLVFAIVGAQMWGGQMRQRCYNIDAGLAQALQIIDATITVIFGVEMQPECT